MKDKKKLEVLLKLMQRIYNKNPGIQEVIDASMIKVCTEGVSRKQVFVILLFLCCFLYQNSYSNKKSKQEW